MKAFYTKSVFILLLFLAQFSATFGQSTEAPIGDGTLENPYKISTLENLYWISQTPSSWDKYFIQTNDINAASTSTWFSNQGFTPIGNNVQKFNGYYNGNNYIISNLYINRPSENNVGLFGHVGHISSTTEATHIKSIGLVNANITGARGVGALIGRVTGNQNTIIEYCYSIGGIVTGDGATGGLIGSFNSYEETSDGSKNPVLRKSHSSNSVISSGNGGLDKFGGLVGCSQKGSIQNSFARGHITVNNGTRIGGLAGCIDYRGDIENSYAIGEITTTSSTAVGGLVGNIQGAGSFDGEVANSLWDTEVSTIVTSPAGIGTTSSDMKTSTTYTNATWDLTSTWGISAGINNGYPYLFGDNNFILPIELQSFEGTRTSTETIELNWTTASEHINEGFEVQKSYNGSMFHTTAWIGGKGTSTIQNSYSFVDNETSLNTLYYRLQQFDRNGASSYSEIITIFPTQTKEQLSFTNKQCTVSNAEINTQYSIAIIKESGKIEYTHSCKAHVETLVCPYILDQGIYVVSIYKNNSVLFTYKIKL